MKEQDLISINWNEYVNYFNKILETPEPVKLKKKVNDVNYLASILSVLSKEINYHQTFLAIMQKSEGEENTINALLKKDSIEAQRISTMNLRKHKEDIISQLSIKKQQLLTIKEQIEKKYQMQVDEKKHDSSIGEIRFKRFSDQFEHLNKKSQSDDKAIKESSFIALEKLDKQIKNEQKRWEEQKEYFHTREELLMQVMVQLRMLESLVPEAERANSKEYQFVAAALLKRYSELSICSQKQKEAEKVIILLNNLQTKLNDVLSNYNQATASARPTKRYSK